MERIQLPSAVRVLVADCDDFQGRTNSGVYTGHHRKPTQSAIPCPYCKEPMIEAHPTETPKRIIRVVKRLKRAQTAIVWAHAIPATHSIVACRECRAVFTVPKDADYSF